MVSASDLKDPSQHWTIVSSVSGEYLIGMWDGTILTQPYSYFFNIDRQPTGIAVHRAIFPYQFLSVPFVRMANPSVEIDVTTLADPEIEDIARLIADAESLRAQQGMKGPSRIVVPRGRMI